MPEFNKDLMGVYLACVLQTLKLRHRLSQRDVATILKISPQLISDFKYSRKPMASRMIDQIACVFNFRWADFALALPDWWSDRDEVIRRNADNPALAEFVRPSDIYIHALLLEVMKLDIRVFPELKQLEVPEQAELSLKLPIRDRPTRGNPSLPPGFSGYSTVVPEPAMLVAQYAERPYLLRLLEDDRRGRFFAGDLLLVDQKTPEEGVVEKPNSVVIINRGEKYRVARRVDGGYEQISSDFVYIEPIPESEVEVVGIVKAVVWSEV